MDLDNNGFIAKRELRKALQRLGTGADQESNHELLAELDRCGVAHSFMALIYLCGHVFGCVLRLRSVTATLS